MSCAQRLKRVFASEIASIEAPEVIARILAHRDRDYGGPEPELSPMAARAPPRQGTLL
jgi:hypothetical protein